MGTTDPFKGASGFDFEYLSNIQLRHYFLIFIPIFSPKANVFVYINHIAMYIELQMMILKRLTNAKRKSFEKGYHHSRGTL